METVSCGKCGYAFKVKKKVTLTECRKCTNTIIIPLCGDCLHHRTSHTTENGHLMKCAVCNGLCALEDFNTDHKPSQLTTVFEIQSKREFSTYKRSGY